MNSSRRYVRRLSSISARFGVGVMFTGIKAPFQAGTKVPLVLRFEGDDQDITVQLEVRPLVPAATDVHAHNMR